MPTPPETVQLFNLKTMSGVFPGARTQVFQRLRLQGSKSAGDPPDNNPVWAHLRWYDEPAACVLFAAHADDGAQAPLLRIENPQKETIVMQLAEALRLMDRRPLCCGNCRFLTEAWVKTPDGFPVGQCQWRSAPPTDASEHTLPNGPLLGHQSVLALGCDHWEPRQRPLAVATVPGANAQSLPPMPKAAEFSAVATKKKGQSRWRRWRALVMKLFERQMAKSKDAKEMTHPALVERSGVGAGTEPCFVCQGRLANLSALVVESAEGDKQTYSLWRCRNCYSYFLSDWVDRWERLDSLETEEHHYRLAPAEAQQVLAKSAQIQGSDHPAGREQRADQRIWFEQFLHARQPLSHQIKLGR